MLEELFGLMCIFQLLLIIWGTWLAAEEKGDL